MTIFVGLIYSFALISIGVLLLSIEGLRSCLKDKRIKANRVLLFSVMTIFIIFLLSGINSNNLGEYINKVRIKIPYLVLPIAFLYIKPISKTNFRFLLHFFFWLMVFSSSKCLIDYFGNMDSVNDSYLYAKTLLTPISHIRFSIMAAIAVFTGVYLYRHNYFLFLPLEKFLIAVCTVFLFIFLHILAVRSGLGAIYIGGIFMAFYLMLKKRAFGIALVLILAFVSLPFIAYKFVPSFKNKVDYVRWDLTQYKYGKKVGANSDYKRLISWEIGAEIAKENLWFGIGIGDLKEEVYHKYKLHRPEIEHLNQIMPHNQFLYVFAGIGIFGFIVFTISVLMPLFYQMLIFKDWYFAAFNLSIIGSFFVENTIEGQIGTTLYIIFLLINISYLSGQKIIRV